MVLHDRALCLSDLNSVNMLVLAACYRSEYSVPPISSNLSLQAKRDGKGGGILGKGH